jgi:hypothetical protein
METDLIKGVRIVEGKYQEWRSASLPVASRTDSPARIIVERHRRPQMSLISHRKTFQMLILLALAASGCIAVRAPLTGAFAFTGWAFGSTLIEIPPVTCHLFHW